MRGQGEGGCHCRPLVPRPQWTRVPAVPPLLGVGVAVVGWGVVMVGVEGVKSGQLVGDLLWAQHRSQQGH